MLSASKGKQMKKKCVFISDFDGTITAKDFYWILLDDYIGEKGIAYYHEWKKTQKIGTEFLNTVFSWKKFSQAEMEEAIAKVSIDSHLNALLSFLKESGSDFWILSAGFDFYIEKALERRGLGHLNLFTNPGDFVNDSFIMLPDASSPFYSPVYGIDKEKVAMTAKEQFDILLFAGDSEPDFRAAIHADVIFAKHELARLLEQNEIRYYPYDNFEDILEILSSGGIQCLNDL